jgi:hypothetical protein
MTEGEQGGRRGRALKPFFGRSRELWYALAVIAVVTGLYMLAYLHARKLPTAFSLVGHGIGIVGFILMLMTATLYTIRKRVDDARWGSMAAWLRFHMVTGLVGPYMVLLHTSMRFRGLAGVAMLLTVVVVISGVVGRYLYTAVPRVTEGAEPDLVDRLIAGYETSGMASTDQAVSVAVAAAGGASALPARSTSTTVGLSDRLEVRRRALATWRSVHLPLTWSLFVVAVVHMVGALYYVLGH